MKNTIQEPYPGTIYLAARYSRRLELCGYRDQLIQNGFPVNSRWLNGAHQIANGLPLGASGESAVENGSDHDLCRQFAEEDMSDVLSAETLISFTEPPDSDARRGGRHVEYGIAVACRKRTIVIGYRENVFHFLPTVEFYPTFSAALDALRNENVNWFTQRAVSEYSPDTENHCPDHRKALIAAYEDGYRRGFMRF